MIGAIIGDLAGSIYEYGQIKRVKRVDINNIIEEESFVSDDTILTIAVADAIVNQRDYSSTLREYAMKYKDKIPTGIPYFKSMFSPGFVKWAEGDSVGTSCGNGAMMRVSPVGHLFNNEDDVIKNAYLATIPSHNTEEAIECAKIVALIIFYARRGMSKDDIIAKLNLNICKPQIDKFNYTCKDTIDVCLYSLFQAKNFEESIRLAISFGGDTDTNACIVGSMAEAMYGISDELKLKAMSKLPYEFVEILNKCYERISGIEMNSI